LIHFGTAGWLYKDWEGIVYPSPKPKKFDPLEYLARYFTTVEINSTYYGPASPATAEKWISRVSDYPDFQFTVKLWKLYSQNMGWRLYRRSLLNENKQRAARFGTGGNLIDFGKRKEVPFSDLLNELLEFVDDVVDELGSRKDVTYALEIMRNGTGADRQLRAYAERNDLRDVVDYIVKETEHGVL